MKIRKIIWIVLLLVVWQGLAMTGRFSPLIFPGLDVIARALINSLANGELIRETIYSIILILEGLIIGVLLAAVMSIASITSKWLRALTEILTTLAHPLPGIALLPIIILWLGTGRTSIVFIIVHSVVWPLLLNLTAGFKATPRIYSETAQNFGVKGIALFKDIYIPASLPFLISGLKIAWARAWRALISAEMIFGAVGGQGGLGWYVFKQRVFMDTAGMFSALLIIILIGILVEEIVFERLEAATLKNGELLHMIEKIRGIGIDRTVIKEGKCFQILKDIGFLVQQGEIVCILGPSGCGKSTLLRIIGGFDKPDKGSVLIDGEELKGTATNSILIFQDFNQLLPWKTVIENVIYPLKVNKIGVTYKEREAIAVRNLKMVGLEDSLNSYPHQLSGGMKQKAALARALAMKPSVLLMDEPFGSLDALTRHKMQALLADIWRETGVTIVFVTHDVQESIILGDKIIVMDKNPGVILSIVANSLERPRDIGSEGFSQLYKNVYSLLESRDN